jgi:hypothetical protein
MKYNIDWDNNELVIFIDDKLAEAINVIGIHKFVRMCGFGKVGIEDLLGNITYIN